MTAETNGQAFEPRDIRALQRKIPNSRYWTVLVSFVWICLWRWWVHVLNAFCLVSKSTNCVYFASKTTALTSELHSLACHGHIWMQKLPWLLFQEFLLECWLHLLWALIEHSMVDHLRCCRKKSKIHCFFCWCFYQCSKPCTGVRRPWILLVGSGEVCKELRLAGHRVWACLGCFIYACHILLADTVCVCLFFHLSVLCLCLLAGLQPTTTMNHYCN